MLASEADWSAGERAYVYRRRQGRAGRWIDDERPDPHDYDVEYYVRQLRDNFASRLARGIAPEDFEAVVADPDRPTLFQRPLINARPILSVLQEP
jgi:hypothetical protein